METKNKETCAFNLEFHGGFQTYTIKAYMVRIPDEYNVADDCFAVRMFDNDAPLGGGDTKADAVSDAMCNLARSAESISFWRGLIDKPYGNKIR